MTWWPPQRVRALIKDLVIDELRRLRPDQAAVFGPTDPPEIALDSLERLQVANRIATFFQMREVGLEDNLLATRTLEEWTAILLESLSHYDRAIGFRTSGSTGEPGTVVQRISWLEQEAAFWAELLHDTQAIVSMVPRHHIYGFLFTVLLPQALESNAREPNAREIDLIDARGWLPRRLARSLTANTLIIGYPDFWRLFADDPAPLPEPVWGITSTAPCPDAIASALAPARLQRLIQVYGSTETAGIGWRESPAVDYQLLPGWQRSGQNLLGCYADGKPVHAAVPDALEWRDARHFRILGRHDQAVAIGGINVYPERIARWLEQQPGVHQATVRPMRADEGARLKAFIVPEPPDADPDPLRAQLNAALERERQPMERPRALTFGPSLPSGALGKVADWDCK